MTGAVAPGRAMIRDPAAFIRAYTQVLAPPLVPEVRLHQASEVTPIWEATQAKLDALGLPPPYWAFAWAGGQAIARYLLDNGAVVAGRRVLDFGTGSGLAGIAAKLAGAARVEAVDIDRFAAAAARLNAVLNGVTLEVRMEDIVGGAKPGWDLVLAGDMCYEQPLAFRVEAWLRAFAVENTLVLLGDPGRTYLPKRGLEPVAKYSVQTTRAIEDTDLRNAVVWRVLAQDRPLMTE
jgi:predicted nicotinamide N-methyase